MPRIAIVVSRSNVRHWHERLRRRLLALAPEAEATLIGAEAGEDYPSTTQWLLEFEQLWFRHRGPSLCARSPQLAPAFDFDGSFDVVIDLTNARAPTVRGSLVLRPLYDGAASELAAIATLLSGAAPVLALQDVLSGALVAEGLPSLENAQGLTGGLEAVFSRVITLAEQALQSPLRLGGRPSLTPHRTPTAAATAEFLARTLAVESARRLYHLLCHSPHWRIGWRFIDGPGVLETGALSGERWNKLFASGAGFAADPFPISWRGETYIYYERFDYRTQKGAIFAQRIDASGAKGEPVLALEEPWHLSYPFLIAHEDDLFMIPEASASKAVSIYRCVEFPSKWRCEGPLLSGLEAADATVFSHAGRLWMTSVVRDGVGGYSDTLAIHHAERLMGPWLPHARRPALVDSRLARPAGAVVRAGAALWRPVQDCSAGYGKKLKLARIDRLDVDDFEQTSVMEISPGADWPGTRLHTLNRWGRLECIDGAQPVPRIPWLALAVEAAREQGDGAASNPSHPAAATPQGEASTPGVQNSQMHRIGGKRRPSRPPLGPSETVLGVPGKPPHGAGVFLGRARALVTERLKLHRTAAASVVAMGIKALGSLLALAIFTAAGRAMSVDDFGRLAVWFNGVSLLAVAAVCGQDTFIMRSWGEYAGRGELGLARAAYRFGWRVTIISGFAFAAIFFAVASLFDPKAAFLTILACALFQFTQTLLHYSSHSSRAIAGFVVSETNRELTWRIAALGAVLYGVWRGGLTPGEFFFACVAGMLVSLAFQLSAVRRELETREEAQKGRADARSWLSKALSMWISAIVEAVSQYADVVLVAYFASPVEAGAYFAAARFANVFMMVTTGLHTYSLTHSASLFFSGKFERLQAILRSLAVVSLIFMLPLVLFVIVVGPWLLALFGPGYTAAYPVLVVLTLASFARSLCGPAPGLLLTTGHEKLYSLLVSLATVARLTITAGLTIRFGGLGAAIGWAIGTVPFAVILAVICRRVCGLDPSITAVRLNLSKFVILVLGSAR